MIYSELEAIGAEGSNEYGDYIINSYGKTSGVSNVFEFVAIPNWANHVYFKYGAIQGGTPTVPQVTKYQRDGQTHQVMGSISFNGYSSYDVQGTGPVPVAFVLYDVYYEGSASLDDILSHLADINWPYPTGTVAYFSNAHTTTDAIANHLGTYRCMTTSPGIHQTQASYNLSTFKTRDNTSTVTWNATNVDTSKSNSITINRTSTYIDIKGYFYPKNAIANYTNYVQFCTIPKSILQVNSIKIIYNIVWNDQGGATSFMGYSFSSTNGLTLSVIGPIRKDKARDGFPAGYAVDFQLRILPFTTLSTTSNGQLNSYDVKVNSTVVK